MKYIFIVGCMFANFSVFAQKTMAKLAEKAEVTTNEFVKESKPQKMLAIAKFSSSSTGLITVSGVTTENKLREIEQTAKNFKMDIAFVNEKYERNQLVYCELLFKTNNETKVLTFGNDDLKMLPFSIMFINKYNEDLVEKKLIIKNDKNNKSNDTTDQVYVLS